MESEKVKEIKECLEEFKDDRIGYCTNGIDRFMLTKEDVLTLINELESENERLRSENKDYYDRLNNLQTYINNHEEIWKGNTNNALKQFAEKLKEKFDEKKHFLVAVSSVHKHIDETLKEHKNEE